MTSPREDLPLRPEADLEAGERERATAAREPEPEPKLEAPERERAMAAPESEPEAERETESRRDELHSATTDMAGYHSRFEAVQSEFIDEPRQAVEKAASLVEEAVDLMMHTLQQELEQVRSELGDGKDTERLRIALRRYRDVLESLDTGRKTAMEA